MHKNIEVELRGPLSKDKFTEIEAFLKKYGRFKQYQQENQQYRGI